MPLPLLPDPVELARLALRAQPSVTALVADRIADRTPGGQVAYPRIRLNLISDDEERDPSLGYARVQADCWGDGDDPDATAAALALARTVRAVARDLQGTYAAGVIASCDPGLIIPAPDPTTGRARYVVDLLLTTHA